MDTDLKGNRLALDGQFLEQPSTGSGQYTLHLWRHLAAGEDDLRAVLVRPAGPSASGSPTTNDTNGGEYRTDTAEVVDVAPPAWARGGKARKLWWEQRGVSRAARQAGAAILHVPYFAGPRLAGCPLIVTIHDVIPLIFPEYGNSAGMRLYTRLVSGVARRAAAVITDSDCSRRDIEGWIGIPSERLHVIPLAADPRFRPLNDPEAEAALRARYDLPGPVIFNVGGLDVRKNLAALVEAFAHALPQLPPETRLVIAGRAHSDNHRRYPPLAPELRKWGVERQVVLTGAISEDEKLAFYNLADLYVYPSLYEGFGLTPLEAMACGTPVISSNRSSLGEVVSHGGLLVEPTPARLAAAMTAVLSDDRLKRDLSHRAVSQAGTFSWRRTADLTRDVYRAVLAGQPRAWRARYAG